MDTTITITPHFQEHKSNVKICIPLNLMQKKKKKNVTYKNVHIRGVFVSNCESFCVHFLESVVNVGVKHDFQMVVMQPYILVCGTAAATQILWGSFEPNIDHYRTRSVQEK